MERVLKLYEPLKSYFLSIDKSPVNLENFFSNPASELWLLFVHSQTKLFEDMEKFIEGNKNTIFQVSAEVRSLIEKLDVRAEKCFLSLPVRILLKKLVDDGEINENDFKLRVRNFYVNCADYLKLWSKQLSAFDLFILGFTGIGKFRKNQRRDRENL